MKVTIEKDELVIRMPLDKKGTASATGKTLVHASSHGNTPCGVNLDGRALVVGVNAYTKNPDYKPA